MAFLYLLFWKILILFGVAEHGWSNKSVERWNALGSRRFTVWFSEFYIKRRFLYHFRCITASLLLKPINGSVVKFQNKGIKLIKAADGLLWLCPGIVCVMCSRVRVAVATNFFFAPHFISFYFCAFCNWMNLSEALFFPVTCTGANYWRWNFP